MPGGSSPERHLYGLLPFILVFQVVVAVGAVAAVAKLAVREAVAVPGAGKPVCAT